MSTVLVTGGAGNLGRHVSRLLLQRGHTVRALTHLSQDVVQGVEVCQGDVLTGTGVDESVDGIDMVVHAVAGQGRNATKTEVVGTRTVLEAAGRVGAHFIYPSKVGVDRNRRAYYDAKWDAEGIIEASGSRWSILRTTQFHDLIEAVLSGPVFFKVPGLAFQPIDVTDVARRVVDVAEAGPSGHVAEFGGPELLGIETLADRRERITGRRSRLLQMPRIGSMRDFAEGSHLCPEHRDGTVTWGDWLERSIAV